MPWSIKEFREDRRGGGWGGGVKLACERRCIFQGEINCGNLGEGCGKRDLPGDTKLNNIHCLTSIAFLKQSVQQTAIRSDDDQEKINIYRSNSNKFNI